VMHQQDQLSTILLSARIEFMSFVFIWDQTLTCATYA
jgi:hypothetical protein